MEGLKKFRAFYDVCQEVYDEEKINLKEFTKKNRDEMQFLKGHSNTWTDYN